jgi:hypothetical protein
VCLKKFMKTAFSIASISASQSDHLSSVRLAVSRDEQLTLNQRVQDSSPSAPTNKIKDL